MLTHYATLTYLARWLDEMHVGASIHEVFSQTRNELMLHFEQREQHSALRISVEPHRNFVYLLHDIKRAKRNTIDLFPLVIGRTIDSIASAHHDRTLLLRCSGQLTVAIQMYGSAANVLVVNDQNAIIDAFVRSKETVGKIVTLERGGNTDMSLLNSFNEFFYTLKAHDRMLLREALKSMFPYLGRILVEEVLHRTQFEAATPIASVTDDQVRILFQTLQNLSGQLTQPAPRIYYKRDSPIAFSLISLSQYSHLKCEEFDSINNALRVYVSKSLRDEYFEGGQHELQRQLQTEILRIERTIGKIRADLTNTDRVEQYERYGKILMTYASSLVQLKEEVKLDDPFTGVPVTIPLDLRLTLVQNAERYFDRAKKAKSARRESEERLKTLEKTITVLRTLYENISKCTTGDELKEFIQAQKKELQAYNIIRNVKTDESVPFRIFHVDGGFEVWAGKSSKNNDELTLHYTKPNDLWFHVRGSGGSHVVLRVATGNGEPSKKAKEQAASIAAYYSRQRNAKYVPVAMTEKKYVRKPKGTPAGTVVIEREKVLLVIPALPQKEESRP
ncbi:MAG: NFACT family protein [Bacteroidota bacterium]